jgi:hypothetical protein
MVRHGVFGAGHVMMKIDQFKFGVRAEGRTLRHLMMGDFGGDSIFLSLPPECSDQSGLVAKLWRNVRAIVWRMDLVNSPPPRGARPRLARCRLSNRR